MRLEVSWGEDSIPGAAGAVCILAGGIDETVTIFFTIHGEERDGKIWEGCAGDASVVLGLCL